MRRGSKEENIPQVTLDVVEMTKEHWAEMVRKNHGSSIFFFRSMREFFEMPNAGKGHKIDEDLMAKVDDNDENGIIAYVGKEGRVSLSHYPEPFKSRRNPYYDKEIASEPGLIAPLVFHYSIPRDCLLEAAKEGMLKDLCINSSRGKRVGKAVIQDNLPFWINFLSSTTTVHPYRDDL